MAWVKMDDGYPEHPKVDRVGPMAAWLNVCAWAYCARNLTDGFVSAERVSRLAGVTNPKVLAKALVEANLWEVVDDGYMVHDYLSYNPSREQVLAEREMAQIRKDLYTDPFMRDRIKKRDGNQCRYCARVVNWTDHKSPIGGTYDHVDPRGGNSDVNLVVACRGCNSRKGQRTPDEAAMPLLPPPNPPSNGHDPDGIKPESSRNPDSTQTRIQQSIPVPGPFNSPEDVPPAATQQPPKGPHRESKPKRDHPPVDDEYTEALVAEYGPKLGPIVVREEIAAALNHTAVKKCIDQRLYVRGWLNRDVRRLPTPIRAQTTPRLANEFSDGQDWLRVPSA